LHVFFGVQNSSFVIGRMVTLSAPTLIDGAADRCVSNGTRKRDKQKWKKTRQAVLRRWANAEAHAKAEQVEAETVKSYTERRKRDAPIVAEWPAQHYEGTARASPIWRVEA